MGRMNVIWTWIRQHGVKVLWGLLLVVLCAALLRWWMGPQVQTEAVQRRDVLQTVVASGRVETPHRVGIGAQITGTVSRVPVAEGQVVKRGDVLVELASTELQFAKRQAELAVVQAKGRLRQGKNATFIQSLYHDYKIRDIISIDGSLYYKQGTTFDIRLILTEGRTDTPAYAPLSHTIDTQPVKTFDELWGRVMAEY
jgi:hypothetical protein